MLFFAVIQYSGFAGFFLSSDFTRFSSTVIATIFSAAGSCKFCIVPGDHEVIFMHKKHIELCIIRTFSWCNFSGSRTAHAWYSDLMACSKGNLDPQTPLKSSNVMSHTNTPAYALPIAQRTYAWHQKQSKNMKILLYDPEKSAHFLARPENHARCQYIRVCSQSINRLQDGMINLYTSLFLIQDWIHGSGHKMLRLIGIMHDMSSDMRGKCHFWDEP